MTGESTDDRRRLAEAQKGIVDAIFAGNAPPNLIDADRWAKTRTSLAAKRRREALDAWPEFTASLGEAAEAVFDEWTKTAPSPPPGGPGEDIRLCAVDLLASGRLPREARALCLTIAARFGSSLRGRRRFFGWAVSRRPAFGCAVVIGQKTYLWMRSRGKHPK